jgi:alkaline phosphatase D
MTADYRCVPRVSQAGANAFTRASFALEDGVRGLQQTGDNPLPTARTRRRTKEQIIRDTLRAETHG